MNNIIDKLNNISEEGEDWKKWSLTERKKLLEIYFIISKKEPQIFNLIYSYHGCDSWEDIFRDYNEIYLQDKADGVEIAINNITEEINEHKKKLDI